LDSLIPQWATHYDEFWKAIKRRNLWFIRLRYGAVLVLLSFFILGEFLINFSFTPIQDSAIILISASILLYNIIFHRSHNKIRAEAGRFNVLHFSLIQIIMDLIALSLLIYFTGGIESPLYMLFIFHMIIGSLILPGRIVYALAIEIFIAFTLFAFFEYKGLIPHYPVVGIFEYPLYNNPAYILISTTIFGFVIFTSVFLANGIAKQLYKLEQNLVESFEKLENAEQEKQKYIMAVVHEIKTPISGAISFLNLVINKFTGPISTEVEEKLQRVFLRCNEAIHLINDVLKISKLRLLEQINLEKFELFGLLESIISKHMVNAEAKKMSIELTDNRNIKNDIEGDKFLLELVFSNILSNSVKYAGVDSQIKVTINQFQKKVEVKVCDNGIGIPEEDLKKLFNDFFRASNIRGKAGYEGAGLGLSIVKRIVEKHGGEIKIESPSEFASPGKPGTCAKIYLPG
jgi:signal transduction histidine kinase